MDSVAETRLQHYTPGVYKVLADILLTAFLFGKFDCTLMPCIQKLELEGRFFSGCLTVLSIVSACHLM